MVNWRQKNVNSWKVISIWKMLKKKMRYVQKVSIHTLWKIDIYWRRYKTLCRKDSDASVPFKVMTFLRKSGSLVEVWVKSLVTAAQCSFCSVSRSHGTNFANAHFMLRSCIKISDTVVFGIPRSASSSHAISHRSLLTAAHVCSTFSGDLLVADLPEHGSFSTDSCPS